MSVLKNLGWIANGWVKFGVAISAALWLGGQALDRVLPMKASERASVDPQSGMQVSTTDTQESADGSGDDKNVSRIDSDVVPASGTRISSEPKALSAVQEIGNEVSSGVKAIVVSPVTHTGTAGFLGVLVGLLARPFVDSLKKKQRLTAARKRLSLLEKDRQLLAENGIPSAPASAIAPSAATASIQIPGPQV
jgi:hypothetical protein